MSTHNILKSLLTGSPAPEEMLADLLPSMRWICLEAVAAPTSSQLEAFRIFQPFSAQNLLQTRRALTSGTARVGPFPEAAARNHGETLFTPVGLQWRLEAPTHDELRMEGLAE